MQLPDKKNELRIYGRNACRALFEARPHDIRKVFLLKELRKEFDPLLHYCTKKKTGFTFVSETELKKITESNHHQGICIVSTKPQVLTQAQILSELSKEKGPLSVLLLEGVENPHNLGAILRSAAHFGCQALLLSDDSTIALSSAVYRTSEGGAELVRIGRLTELDQFFSWARQNKFTLLATSPKAKHSLSDLKLPAKAIFAFGKEHSGLSDKLLKACDQVVSIPKVEAIDSLNVSISAAVVLWEFFRQQHAQA